MTDPSKDASGRPVFRFGSKLLLARLALFWEVVWPALWPVVAIAGFFIAVALFDVLPLLPPWLHAVILAVLGAGFVWAVVSAARQIVWPQRDQARRRLESASGFAHRPLEAIEDELALGRNDVDARAIWDAHLARMAEAAKSVRVGVPSPRLARRDPLALRAALALFLVVAIAAGWQDPVQRVARAVVPTFATGTEAALALDLWITPPEYTALAPLFPLRGRKATKPDAATAAAATPEGETAEKTPTVLKIPAGSVLTAQVQGAKGKKARLVLAKTTEEFERVDATYSRIVRKISSDGRLAITLDNETLADWQVEIIPDKPPTIKFSDPPGGTPHAALRISYEGEDDYGIVAARAEIRRTYERGAVIGKAVHTIDLPLPGRGARTVRETAFFDLAPHRWAGQPVIIELIATDADKQTGRAEPIRMVLPERVFQHPVARAIIEARKLLAEQPENRRRVLRALGEIASVPDAFGHDSVVYLALASARSRLVHETTEDAIDPVLDLLWDTALRLEDGKLSIAERELRRIQQALMKALAEGASDKELERLMRELRQALNRYLRALAEQMRRNPNAQQQVMEFDPNTMRMLRSEDLARMLDQIRDLMRSGARQAAREMLARLQQMLEGLRSMQVMRMRGGRGMRGSGALRQLQDLIRRQQELMNRTFRSGRPGQQGGMPSPGDQQALQEMLRQLRGMMPGPGQGQQPGQGPGQLLDQADQEMGRAVRSLEGGRPMDAVGNQGRALDQLRRAGRGLMQQMMERFARQSGMPRNQRNGRNAPKRDPLGREVMGEDVDSSDVHIPDAGAIQRAREILDELRRRSGQINRPRMELDYIERLLQRF